MLLINTLIVLLVPLILGVFMISVALRENSSYFKFWEKLAISFALGLGFLAVLMFLFAFANIPLTFWTVTGTVLLIVLIAGLYLLKKKQFLFNFGEFKNAFNFKISNFSILECILVLLISLKVIYVFFITLIKPLVDVDAFQFYSIVAKGVYFEKTFLTPYLRQFIGDKPLFSFLSQGWAFIGLHAIDDALFKIFTPILFLCFIIIFYSVLRRYYERGYALLFTFLLSTLPFIVFHAATAYADFPMTFYYAAATIYLFLFMKELSQNNKEKAFANITIALLFLAISIWVKRAGIVIAGIDLFILFIYLIIHGKFIAKPDLLKIIIPFLLFMILVIPSIAYSQSGTLLRISKSIVGVEEQVSPIPSAEGPSLPAKAGIIVSIFLKKTFLYADWHLLWLLFLVTLLFFYKRSFGKPNAFLLAVIIIDILAILVQFKSREMFNWLLDGTLLDRLLMNQAPIILYFCAEAIIPGLRGSSSAGAVRAFSKNKKGS